MMRKRASPVLSLKSMPSSVKASCEWGKGAVTEGKESGEWGQGGRAVHDKEAGLSRLVVEVDNREQREGEL
jgi:hypothetical protein